ncbi:hypothetical protein HPB48_009940 [Haemaphysalis longicornis]|uniref:HSF-type DNA-binding domain-containing protein n=1 Tax=Haemaphysalis longicornis TaxID=44386 RepID=A0A9J6GK86_HAELO|nr:hypothetical protein HPB48_009940 [Haemaphysalis longicornis]
MNSTEAAEKSQRSSRPKDPSVLALSFPQKLFKIVNECKSGAIAWTMDGTAVVIDYAKFQSDYLENREDFFKTNNVTSFIRQLNLYGFRNVSYQYSATVCHQSRPDLHVFRNDSFIRGHPEMLAAVTRRKGGAQGKMNQKDDGDGPGPSSGIPHLRHVPVRGGTVMRSQANGMSSHQTQAEAKRALDSQRQDAQTARLERPSARPHSVSTRAGGASSDMTAREYNRAYWDSLWSSEDSTSDTETGDEEESSTHSVVQEEAASASTESSSSVAGGGVADYAASDSLVDDLIQRTTESESQSESRVDEMATLLDPNQPPSVVLTMFQGCDDELNHMPTVEDYLRVDPTIRPVGDSSDDDSSNISP